MNRPVALYVHIPFCRRKCGYCSFVSSPRREAEIPAYVSALKAEMFQAAARTSRDACAATSIYFGGGTPSLLSPDQLAAVLATARSVFDVSDDAEVSIEANPGTIDEAYLKTVRTFGVNRLSLGVQSLNDDDLAMLRRIHTANEARQAVSFARNAGFDNLNIDLIYSLPGQTLAGWRKTLEDAIALEPEHLSLYALTLEEDTPLFHATKTGELPAIDPDLSADQYELAEDLLAGCGYRHYEISNWAKPGYECRHNLVYWHNEDYVGIGVAAHSSIDGHRLANTADLDKYLSDFSEGRAITPEMDEEIDAELQLAETVILGLRLCEGVNPEEVGKRHGVGVLSRYVGQIQEMTEAGLLEHIGSNLRLTPRGRLMSNEVFWRLLPEPAAEAGSNRYQTSYET